MFSRTHITQECVTFSILVSVLGADKSALPLLYRLVLGADKSALHLVYWLVLGADKSVLPLLYRLVLQAGKSVRTSPGVSRSLSFQIKA